MKRGTISLTKRSRWRDLVMSNAIYLHNLISPNSPSASLQSSSASLSRVFVSHGATFESEPVRLEISANTPFLPDADEVLWADARCNTSAAKPVTWPLICSTGSLFRQLAIVATHNMLRSLHQSRPQTRILD